MRPAIRNIRRHAESGDAVAQFCLAVLAEAQGMEEDAFNWYSKAGEQGLPLAQLFLGLHLEKKGFQYWDGAALVLRRASEAGLAEAAYSLAAMHSLGYGGAASESESIKWLYRAAELGDTRAHTWLGVIYRDSLKHKNLDLAETFFRKGAELGDFKAKSFLGDLLIEKPDQQHIDEGIKLIREAADANVSDALRRLSELYATGRFGFPVDKTMSRNYSVLFAKSLSDEAGM